MHCNEYSVELCSTSARHYGFLFVISAPLVTKEDTTSSRILL